MSFGCSMCLLPIILLSLSTTSSVVCSDSCVLDLSDNFLDFEADSFLRYEVASVDCEKKNNKKGIEQINKEKDNCKKLSLYNQRSNVLEI